MRADATAEHPTAVDTFDIVEVADAEGQLGPVALVDDGVGVECASSPSSVTSGSPNTCMDAVNARGAAIDSSHSSRVCTPRLPSTIASGWNSERSSSMSRESAARA